MCPAWRWQWKYVLSNLLTGQRWGRSQGRDGVISFCVCCCHFVWALNYPPELEEQPLKCSSGLSWSLKATHSPGSLSTRPVYSYQYWGGGECTSFCVRHHGFGHCCSPYCTDGGLYPLFRLNVLDLHQVSSRGPELSIVHRLLPAFEVVFSPLSFSSCCSHRCGTSLPPSNLGGCSFRFWKAFFFLPSAFGLFCYIHKRNKAFYSSMTWKMMGSKLYFQHITVPLAVWTWPLAEYFEFRLSLELFAVF